MTRSDACRFLVMELSRHFGCARRVRCVRQCSVVTAGSESNARRYVLWVVDFETKPTLLT